MFSDSYLVDIYLYILWVGKTLYCLKTFIKTGKNYWTFANSKAKYKEYIYLCNSLSIYFCIYKLTHDYPPWFLNRRDY